MCIETTNECRGTLEECVGIFETCTKKTNICTDGQGINVLCDDFVNECFDNITTCSHLIKTCVLQSDQCMYPLYYCEPDNHTKINETTFSPTSCNLDLIQSCLEVKVLCDANATYNTTPGPNACNSSMQICALNARRCSSDLQNIQEINSHMIDCQNATMLNQTVMTQGISNNMIEYENCSVREYCGVFSYSSAFAVEFVWSIVLFILFFLDIS